MMPGHRGVVVLSVSLVCRAAISAEPAAAPVTVIRAGVLIDGVSSAPKPNQVIVVRGNRVESVGDAGAQKIPDGARVIDLSGATVLPGLIDAHTHVLLHGEEPAEGGYDAQLLKETLAYRAARATVAVRRALEQGFTTIRDVDTEGAGYADIGIKRAIDEGYIPGPRMFVATRAISSTGGYPLEDYAPEVVVPKGVQIADGPVEARKAARRVRGRGRLCVGRGRTGDQCRAGGGSALQEVPTIDGAVFGHAPVPFLGCLGAKPTPKLRPRP